MIQCVTPWAIIWNLFHTHQCADVYSLTYLTESFSFFQYLPYFLKTLLLELPLYFLFFRTIKKIPKIFEINLVVNLATHPIIFFIVPMIIMQFQATYLYYVIIAEIFAPVVEALILYHFYKISFKRAALAALCANLFSWAVGIYWI